MKIYKIGENKYYKGECKKCGTGVICSRDDDHGNMVYNIKDSGDIEYATFCPKCSTFISLIEITKQEYVILRAKALNIR